MLAETASRDQRLVSAVKTEKGRSDVDLARLEAALKRRIKGEVRFDAGSRPVRDLTAPIIASCPSESLSPGTLTTCRKPFPPVIDSAPVLSRGGGTSLAGQCCNVAVADGFHKSDMNRVLEIDAGKRLAR